MPCCQPQQDSRPFPERWKWPSFDPVLFNHLRTWLRTVEEETYTLSDAHNKGTGVETARLSARNSEYAVFSREYSG